MLLVVLFRFFFDFKRLTSFSVRMSIMTDLESQSMADISILMKIENFLWFSIFFVISSMY